MAYVDVPKDLTNIKTKFIGHFTKRQCICFGLGIVVGFPGYFIARAAIGTTAAFYVLIAIMAPFFLFGIVEKDGLPLEVYMLNFILNMEDALSVTMHIDTLNQTEAMKYIKGKLSDINKMKIEEQKKAIRSGYDMDIIPPDIETYSEEAHGLLKEMQSRNERLFKVTFLITSFNENLQKMKDFRFTLSNNIQSANCALRKLDHQQEQGLISSLPLGKNFIKQQIEKELMDNYGIRYTDISGHIKSLKATNNYLASSISKNRDEISELRHFIDDCVLYKKLKIYSINEAKAPDKEMYYQEHDTQLNAFHDAEFALKNRNIDLSQINSSSIKILQKRLLQAEQEIRELEDQQRQNEREINELQNYQKEINTYLGRNHEDI